MRHEIDTLEDKGCLSPGDNGSKRDAVLESRSVGEIALLEKLLDQVRSYHRVEICILLGTLGFIVWAVHLFMTWCTSNGIDGVELSQGVIVVAAIPRILAAIIPQRKMQAALEKIAPLLEKRDLNRLVPLLIHYDSKNPFFLRIERFFALVEEADAGMFSRSEQKRLVHCFRGLLKTAAERYGKAGRMSEEARRVYVSRYPKHATETKRRKEVEQPRIEAHCRFAEGVLRALARVGDRASLQDMEKILRQYPNVDFDSQFAQRVSKHLELWHERLKRQDTPNTLLRPSLKADPGILLRPTTEVSAPVQELLRVATKDPLSPH